MLRSPPRSPSRDVVDVIERMAVERKVVVVETGERRGESDCGHGG